MSEYGEGRKCAICGAAITDNNPDGIGYTCRDTWNKALWDTYYHFRGLDAWKLKVNYWLNVFIKTFQSTKFRSSFKKSFFQSMLEVSQKEGHLSNKQLDIMKDYLISGMWAKYPYGTPEAEQIINEERQIIHQDLQQFVSTMTSEQQEYRVNCAKKHYGESAKTEGSS